MSPRCPRCPECDAVLEDIDMSEDPDGRQLGVSPHCPNRCDSPE